MAHLKIRPGVRRLATALILTSVGAVGVVTSEPPHARADAVAYVVNVTVRPGYNFASAEHALAYGRAICDKGAQGRTYAQIMADVKADFRTTDEYQASYLITQALNELCPASIWQLRNSAAHYGPPRQ
jgi:hypothetical protein